MKRCLVLAAFAVSLGCDPTQPNCPTGITFQETCDDQLAQSTGQSPIPLLLETLAKADVHLH